MLERTYLVQIRVTDANSVQSIRLQLGQQISFLQGSELNTLRNGDEVVIERTSRSLFGLFKPVINYKGDAASIGEVLLYFFLHFVNYVLVPILTGLLFLSRFPAYLHAKFKIDLNLVLLIMIVFPFHTIATSSVFAWTALDNFPYFARLENPDFVHDDFTTNTIETPNPRMIFVKTFHFLAQVLGQPWYLILFFLGFYGSLIHALLIYVLIIKILNFKDFRFNTFIVLLIYLSLSDNHIQNLFSFWLVYQSV